MIGLAEQMVVVAREPAQRRAAREAARLAIAAKAAALDYLHAAGVEGNARVVNGDTLIVTTTDTYTSKFLGIIGLDTMRVTGEASARLIRAEGGIER